MEIIQFITNFGFCYFPLSCSVFRVVLLTVALPTELCENIARIFRFSYIKLLLFILVLYGQMLCQLSYARIYYKPNSRWVCFCSGSYLLSQAVAHQVSSTLRSLTSVFGMGTGGSSLLSPPDFFGYVSHTLKTKQYNSDS